MDFLFLMDPIERVNPTADTTYALIRSTVARGHESWVAPANAVSLDGGTPYVTARPVTVPAAPGAANAHFAYSGEPQLRALATFQVVWIRPDPPFDLPYVELTWMLDRVDRTRTLVVNDPTGVRGANEKLYALRFPELCPPTLVTSDRAQLRAFVDRHREVVFKPLGACGGAGILFAHHGMRGLNAVLEVATDGRRCEAQAYLPSADQGDKRILLLDGEPLGAILRVHGAGEERNNLHLGGRAERSTLDAADREIVAALAADLRKDGLYFVGLDVIGGKLTEVNVTSPTGIQEMERFDGADLCGRVIAWCESRSPRA